MELYHIALIVSTEECLSFYKKLGFEDACSRCKEMEYKWEEKND